MKKPNKKNNLVTEKSKTSTNEPFFGDNAEQSAQQVVPLAQTVYANAAPTVSMRTPGKRFNPLLLISIFALAAAVGAIAVFYSASNREAKSASTEAAFEENKIEPVVVNVPQTLKTETASPETPIAAPVNHKRREKRESREMTSAPVSISEEALSDEQKSDKDETEDDRISPPLPNRVLKDKKREKFLRKAERAREKIKEFKEIFDEFDDN